jgi:uncharacterized protein (DUF305 family)
MKRTSMLLAAGLASITLAACGGTSTTPAAPAATAPASSAAAGTTGQAHNAADVTFAQGMIPHHKQAVMMAQQASSRAKSPAVKTLAAQIQSAQDPEITTMTGWLTSWGQPTQQPGMSGMAGHDMGSMGGSMSDADMTKLSKLTGAVFDREFLTMMTAHHNGAIEMARTQLAQGQYPPAKALAQNIITSQTAEIAKMKTLLTQV